MLCVFGIAHSGLVMKRVVIDSCHMRRLVCTELEEMSSLRGIVSTALALRILALTAERRCQCLSVNRSVKYEENYSTLLTKINAAQQSYNSNQSSSTQGRGSDALFTARCMILMSITVKSEPDLSDNK